MVLADYNRVALFNLYDFTIVQMITNICINYGAPMLNHITFCLQSNTGAILEIRLSVGVIPLNATPLHILLTIFLRFYSRRVQMPLWRALSAVFCTKLRVIYWVRLVWRHRVTNFSQKILFVQVKGWSRDHQIHWVCGSYHDLCLFYIHCFPIKENVTQILELKGNITIPS